MICEVCHTNKPLTYRMVKLSIASICAPCIRENYPWTLGGRDDDVRDAVVDVLAWMMKHPHRDYIDAAFAVVAAPPPFRSEVASRFSTNRWPELIDAVKLATQNWTALS